MTKKELIIYALIIIGIVLLCLWNLFIGYVPISGSEVISGLTNKDPRIAMILYEIRIPRALLGLCVGFSIGLSGATLQGLLRNPLADPGLLGVSPMAGLGAVIVIYFGLSSFSIFALPIVSMLGASLAVLLLFLLAGTKNGILSIILSGVAISSLAMALTSLAINLSPNPWSITEILFWIMGSFRDRTMFDLKFAFPFLFVGSALLLSNARALNALSLGEDTAKSLGVNLHTVYIKLIIGTALCVGASTATSGSIGFIGLVIPHLMRPVVNHDPGKLLLASALGGALLMMIADISVRLIPTNTEMNLGVLTALIGAPFFFYLITKAKKTL